MVLSFLANSAPLVDQLRLAVIVIWAMILGGLVGVEREKASKASGIRTHMLVAGASAMVVYVSAQVTATSGGDASRGIHGVITGIGFLGAGAIMQHSKRGVVSGLTTAASIFYTAAIGTAVAAGYGVAASVGTVLAIGVLYGLGHFAHHHPVRPVEPSPKNTPSH